MKRFTYLWVLGQLLLLPYVANGQANPFDKIVSQNFAGYFTDSQGFMLELVKSQTGDSYTGSLYLAGESAGLIGELNGGDIVGQFSMSGVRVPFKISSANGSYHFSSDGFETTLQKQEKPELAGYWEGKEFSIIVKPGNPEFTGIIRMNEESYSFTASLKDPASIEGNFSDKNQNSFPFSLVVVSSQRQANFSSGNFKASLSWQPLDTALKMLAREEYELLSKKYFDVKRDLIKAFIASVNDHKLSCTDCSPRRWSTVLFAKDQADSVVFIGGMQGTYTGRRLNPNLAGKSIFINQSSMQYELGLRVEASVKWDDLLSPDTEISISKHSSTFRSPHGYWQLHISNEERDILNVFTNASEPVQEAINHQAYPGCDSYDGCVDVATRCQPQRCIPGRSDYYWDLHLSNFFDRDHIYWPIKTYSKDHSMANRGVRGLSIRAHRLDEKGGKDFGRLLEIAAALEQIDLDELARAENTAFEKFRLWSQQTKVGDCSSVDLLRSCP